MNIKSITSNTAAALSLTAIISILAYYALLSNNKASFSNDDDETKDDHKQSTNQSSSVTNSSNYSKDDWLEKMPSHIQREIMKERRRRSKLEFLAMKSPMYDNVQMMDPHGELLAKISKKKAKWYVNKGLAKYCYYNEGKVILDSAIQGKNMSFDSLTRCIQLNFEPKDNSSNTTFHTADKQNICVKCGRGDYHLMRHHIVPSAYRTLLPKKFKSHMSHDITLLCGDCHVHCQQECQKRMNEIEALCPRQPGSEAMYINDDKMYKVRSSALALLNWRHKIPQDQIKVHEKLVRDYLLSVGGFQKIKPNNSLDDQGKQNHHHRNISNSQLQEVIDMDYRIENPHYIPGPELVVKSIIDDEDKIAHFVRSWRQHFLDTVQPRFLPEGWSIEHDVTSNAP